MTQYEIRDNGDLKRYFIQIPNIIDDMNLSVYAFRLYCHLKRVAGDGGECYQSTDTLAKSCGVGKGTISRAKKELEQAKLITVRSEPCPGGFSHHIEINDIWSENIEAYQRSPRDQGSPQELQRSTEEPQRSPLETKKNPLRRTPEQKLNLHKQNYFPIANALSKVTKMDLNINKPRIFKAAKTLSQGVGVTPEKILQDYSRGGVWYTKDWRGQKGQTPTLQQVLDTWGTFPENGKSTFEVTDIDALERARESV